MGSVDNWSSMQSLLSANRNDFGYAKTQLRTYTPHPCRFTTINVTHAVCTPEDLIIISLPLPFCTVACRFCNQESWAGLLDISALGFTVCLRKLTVFQFPSLVSLDLSSFHLSPALMQSFAHLFRHAWAIPPSFHLHHHRNDLVLPINDQQSNVLPPPGTVFQWSSWVPSIVYDQHSPTRRLPLWLSTMWCLLRLLCQVVKSFGL